VLRAGITEGDDFEVSEADVSPYELASDSSDDYSDENNNDDNDAPPLPAPQAILV